MILKAITFGISISFISWIVGIIGNSILVKTEYYKKLSNLNFIKSERLNQLIGIECFKWIVKNTFFKFFNDKIKIKDRKVDLSEIRNEMTIAETGHLIAFVFVVFFAVYKGFSQGFLFGLIVMVVNVFMNLYPSLLQQENKRRLDKVIARNARTNKN